MSKMTRGVAVGALASAMMLTTLGPASAAANPKASCVGVIVSTQAPAGEFDVESFKDLAGALGAPNFGQFVAGGATTHAGTVEACLPAAP